MKNMNNILGTNRGSSLFFTYFLTESKLFFSCHTHLIEPHNGHESCIQLKSQRNIADWTEENV